MFELTQDRKILLETQDHILASGGPGSGKTTIALLKAEHYIRTGKLKIGQRVLFLSFARSSIARIIQHAEQIISGIEQKFLEVNTYHGFAWNHLKNHGYLINSNNPIRLLSPHEAASRLAEISCDHARAAEKQRLFKEEGLLHFDFFAKVCAELFFKSKILTDIICDVYPLIILDEFQDTNKDEWDMIRILGNRSHLIALADENQRIYGFRGASPKRIEEFIATYSPTKFDFDLENYRSNGTDIIVFGNDLLKKANIGKQYNNVVIKTYGFYRGRSSHYLLKTILFERMRKQSNKENWSIAVLAPTNRLMLAVSDYLMKAADGLPALNHEVALDTEAPALAAVLISKMLECTGEPSEIIQTLIFALCGYIRGRKGNKFAGNKEINLAKILQGYLTAGKKSKSENFKEIIQAASDIAEERYYLQLSGNPVVDWDSIRRLFFVSNNKYFKQVAEDAEYLRLLHQRAVLRSRLSELWRSTGNYQGASITIQEALLQEHFLIAVKKLKGIHVMTMHKSKGKEFNEVIIYEDSHQGRIVRANANYKDIAQARVTLRMAVTRAMERTTILTPKHKICTLL